MPCIDKNCADCSSDKDICTVCSDSYSHIGSDTKTCVKCEAKHCATCKFSADKCGTCVPGFRLEGSKC